tara:strand:- start:2227 stop:2565 length:339 start_codon:yes stop_codon:yes gene_type:complete
MARKYKGELLKGRAHAEGGIPVRVANSQMVEMEGGEGVVNKRAMASSKKYKFEGESMASCDIVSEINQKEGDGVAFDCDDIEGRQYKLDKGGKAPIQTLLFLPYSIGSMLLD